MTRDHVSIGCQHWIAFSHMLHHRVLQLMTYFHHHDDVDLTTIIYRHDIHIYASTSIPFSLLIVISMIVVPLHVVGFLNLVLEC